MPPVPNAPAPLPSMRPVVVTTIYDRLLTGLLFLAVAWPLGAASVGVAGLLWAMLSLPYALQLIDAQQDRPPGDLFLLDRRVAWRSQAWIFRALRIERAVKFIAGGVGLLAGMVRLTQLESGDPAVVPQLIAGVVLLLLAAKSGALLRFHRAAERWLVHGNLEGAERLYLGLLQSPTVGPMARCSLAQLRLESGRPDEAEAVLGSDPVRPDLLGFTRAAAQLMQGDAALAHRLLAEAPTYPRAGGARMERHLATELRAALALEEGRPADALKALDGITEPTPVSCEVALATLRAAALHTLDRPVPDDVRHTAGLWPRPPWTSRLPTVHASLEALDLPRSPRVDGRAEPLPPASPRPGTPPDPTNPYAATATKPSPMPSNPPPKPYLGRARPPHAHLLPVETVAVGRRWPAPRLQGVPLWLKALGGLSMVPALLLPLTLVRTIEALGRLGLGVALLFFMAASMTALPRDEGPWALGDGRRLGDSPRRLLGLHRSADLLFGGAVTLLLTAPPVFLPLPIFYALGVGFWAWRSHIPPRRVHAAWAVHTAALDALPDAMARHRADDTEPWWVLAHLLAGRTDEAAALADAIPPDRRMPRPLASWFAAARGALDRDVLGAPEPRAGAGPRYRRAMAIVLATLAAGSPLPDDDLAEGTDAARALPDRFGGGLVRLQWHALRAHDPDAATAYALDHPAELDRGIWVDRAWPSLLPP